MPRDPERDLRRPMRRDGAGARDHATSSGGGWRMRCSTASVRDTVSNR